MLDSYFQNSSVGVTKATYFEICEQLGTTPNEDEIPVELEDFPLEVQQAFMVYYRLRDEWEGMSGTYMGKSFAGLQDLYEVFQIPQQDRQYVLDCINLIDAARSRSIELSKPKT